MVQGLIVLLTNGRIVVQGLMALPTSERTVVQGLMALPTSERMPTFGREVALQEMVTSFVSLLSATSSQSFFTNVSSTAIEMLSKRT